MPDVEIIDPRFASMVLPNAPLETLATGFRWLEGPIWFADHQCLLFSDIPNDRVMRWNDGGVTIFREPSHFANGHARDRLGRLISCLHQDRCVIRTEVDGKTIILAQEFEGNRLNAPNDVIVHSDGAIWFTDPHYGINTDYEGGKQPSFLRANVYRLAADGSLCVVAADFDGPNGLCFSPDEQHLYVVESGLQFSAHPRRFIKRFKVNDGQALSDGEIFAVIEPGMADGIKCDEEGNLWSSAGDGVHCLSRDGTLLGKIKTSATVSNIAFGGRHLSRLFICAGDRLLAIYTNVRGTPLV